MSSPVREPDDNEPLKDGALEGATLKVEPKRARRSDQNSNLNAAPKRGDAAPSNTMPEPPEPPWKRKTQHEVFAGDVAAVELRSRLALVPDRIPEPPPPTSTWVFVAVGQLIGVILIAAAVSGIIGYQWGSAPSAEPPQPVLTSNQADLRPGLSAPAANHKASSFDSTPPASQPAATELAPVDARSVAKEQNSRDAASALRQLEWSGRSAVGTGKSPSQGDAAAIALMMTNGAQLMTNGDIAAARMMFQRAAEAGEAMGAFALAETYDPSMLKKLGTRGGITSDIALAQNWYEKARDLGSTVAPERLKMLARLAE